MKRIGRAPAAVAAASALSLLLAGCAIDAGGSPQPSATATVNACAPPGSHPAFIAILLQGISSEVSSSGSFNPATTSFCASPDGQMPPDNPQVAIQTLANGWLNWSYDPNTDQNDAKNPSTVGAGKNLIDALAHAGGYVLPFSYVGATMSGSPSSPSFTLTPYNADDVGAQDPTTTEPSILQKEIFSIHKVFQHTKIIVIGHSNGGLIAEQWWLQDGSVHPEGVIHVFALDAPVNGVSDGFFCVPLGCTSAVGPLPGSAYARLWRHQTANDTAALKLDNADHLFTPVGSYGDPLYDAADPAVLNVPIGIASQLFHPACDPALQSCDPTLPPDFIDPCATKHKAEDRAYSPPAYGILLHSSLSGCTR